MSIEVNGLRVDHPRMTPQDLINLSAAGELIERSDHVGNQHLAALVTMTDPRIRVRQLLVDTTTGNDQEYRPRSINVLGQSISVVPNKMASRNVRHLSAVISPENAHKLGKVKGVTVLTDGADVTSHHQGALQQVTNGKSTVELLTGSMQRTPKVAESIMKVLAAKNLLKRSVGSDGRIIPFASIVKKDLSIFGMLKPGEPLKSRVEGVLIPLEGMLALDLAQASLSGIDVVHHQAGCDMRVYTKNEALMSVVASVALEALSEHVENPQLPNYRVVDTTNIAVLMSESTAVMPGSQYDEQLLVSLGAKPTQFPESVLDKPLYT